MVMIPLYIYYYTLILYNSSFIYNYFIFISFQLFGSSVVRGEVLANFEY